jgi:ubiquinone/menaquinone biosynthesis C-methylase UbiE
MLEMATSRNAVAIRDGRVRLELASATSLPFGDATFEKAYSINCSYFWDDPVHGLREIRRVLKPGGRVAVTARDKRREACRVPELEKMFSAAGFSHAVVLHNGVTMHPLLCAVGEK